MRPAIAEMAVPAMRMGVSMVFSVSIGTLPWTACSPFRSSGSETRPRAASAACVTRSNIPENIEAAMLSA